MGLLSGSASVTRCRVTSRPDTLDFDQYSFEEIPPGSTIRERVGFLPFEPGAAYQIGQHRWAFRVRIDTLKPDPTAVQEYLKELIRAEREATGTPFVHPKRRRALKQLAEEDLLVRAAPRSRVIECCLDDNTLWIGTTAKGHIGIILGQLHAMGIVPDFQTPWAAEAGDGPESEVVGAAEPWQSVFGCRFLRLLLEDPEIAIESERGAVRLATRDAGVTLTGDVMTELLRYVERGAEILSAKMVTADSVFRFDALNFRLTGIRIETESHDHWEELLDERLEKISDVHDFLDRRFAQLRPRMTK